MVGPVRLLLLIDLTSEFDRKLFRGLMRYSNEHGPWLFNVVPSSFGLDESGEDAIYNLAVSWKADAILGRWNSSKAEKLSTLGIPIVFQNFKSRSEVYSNLTGDYYGTGELAADFFLRHGFKNFAFCGLENIVWSVERANGFQDRLRSAGYEVSRVEMQSLQNEVGGQFIEWLLALPKPVAMFCCDDYMSLKISALCRFNGIKVPEDVSLLGVDNDELSCHVSDPELSSIDLQVEQGGYLTAQLIHDQIKSGKLDSSSVVIVPTGIIERKSTARHNISDEHINSVVEYIERRYAEDISIADLVDLVPLARRTLELRFKKVMGTTIYQYLLGCRINRLAQLLLSTDLPINDLAYDAGFRDLPNLSRVFKKAKGCSPSQFRHRSKF